MFLITIFPILIIISIFFSSNQSENFISFDFTTELNSSNEKKHFFESFFPSHNIIIKIKIGTPLQKIPLVLRSNNYNTAISSSSMKNFENTIKFNENESSTFKTSNISSHYMYNEFSFAMDGRDKLEIEKNKIINNFSFLLIKEMNVSLSGLIGLKLVEVYMTNDFNFIQQLKGKKLIKEIVYFVLYDNKKDFEGKFFIGSYPHEIFNDENYNEKNFIFVKAGINKNQIDYVLNFDNIFTNSVNLRNTRCLIRYEFGFILGSKEYQILIETHYFKDKLFEEKKCFKYVFLGKYLTFYCNKNEIDKKEFKNIKFFLHDFNFNFVFDFDDLFYLKDNFYYFLIVFDLDSDNNFHWILGMPFIKKYLIVFDLDKKIIGFYNNNIIIKNGKNNIFFYVFWYIFLIGIIIVLVFYILRFVYFKKNKRIIANELNEGIYYVQQKDNYLIN